MATSPIISLAVLGAGAGGAAAAVDLVRAGHDVLLWNRSKGTLAPMLAAGAIHYEGVLGEGSVRPRAMTSDLATVVAECEAALVVLPTFLHEALGADLARAGWPASRPVILNPGHSGGALAFAEAFRRVAGKAPAVAEFSTLTYVARKPAGDRVSITGRADKVRAAALPGGEAALALACRLFPRAEPQRDVIATALSNVNMVLHPPGAVLGASWVEARQGDFRFYVDGMTPGTARVMERLDGERRAVADAYGHKLPSLIDEMKRIGTVESTYTGTDFAGAISGGEANRRIKAPNNFTHRYYQEDFGFGLLPFLALAEIAGVECPTADALLTLGDAATGADFRRTGRDAVAMGIAGRNRDSLLQQVRLQ